MIDGRFVWPNFNKLAACNCSIKTMGKFLFFVQVCAPGDYTVALCGVSAVRLGHISHFIWIVSIPSITVQLYGWPSRLYSNIGIPVQCPSKRRNHIPLQFRTLHRTLRPLKSIMKWLMAIQLGSPTTNHYSLIGRPFQYKWLFNTDYSVYYIGAPFSAACWSVMMTFLILASRLEPVIQSNSINLLSQPH